MSNKMLIDASHQEETRVVVVRGNRIEEFDFESQHKKQLKGNIYLARVTRVEPSLQAAFVEYGGNRHGFLAFSEIHPDYYQIPVADRQALIEAEEQAAIEDNEEDDLIAEKSAKKKRGRQPKKATIAEDVETDTLHEDAESVDVEPDEDNENSEDSIESVGAGDAMEEVPTQRFQRKQYKIQEVIKRRQILLIQVVKEERGNKGAALTTYLSLAGRYSVLMPNTARGGGISRKITNVQDRKRLKDIVKELEVPKGMGVILRTAGANRTKVEVKRDYEYLMRLWENVRNLTLQSTAPALVYEEGSLIKRSIRDLYNKDISEILVAGDEGYREAKDFMRMLMPSHAKVVQPYRDPYPIFARNGIETQLDKMLQPQVTLKSGGYLVINQTEALVAIDVNSGRSTKEHSIEETAYQTNIEAAEEVARQLRLRDLAGLVVIDFIDMDEKRNIRAVEKRLKDCLKDDRARIQVGRISHFGLMEMSRQRIRASVLESTTQPCTHCGGTGHVRSDSSLALHVVRTIEEYLLRNGHFDITVRTPVSTALYVLNHKRTVLADLEKRFGLVINFETDESVGNQHLIIIKGAEATGTPAAPIQLLPVEEEDPIEDITFEDEEENNEQTESHRPSRNRRRRGQRGERHSDNENGHNQNIESSDSEREEDRRRRRRRGRRGGRRNRDGEFDRRRLPYAEPVGAFAEQALREVREARRRRHAPAAEPVGNLDTFIAPDQVSEPKTQTKAKKSRRNNKTAPSTQEIVDIAVAETPIENISEEAPKKRGRKKAAPKQAEVTIEVESDIKEIEESAKKTKKAVIRRSKKAANETIKDQEPATNSTIDPPKKTTRTKKAASKKTTEEAISEPVVTSSNTEPEAEKPKRAGWWQRKSFF